MSFFNISTRPVIGLCLIALALQSCAVTGGSHLNNSINTTTSESAEVLFSQIDRAENAYKDEFWGEASNLYQEILKSMPDDAYIWFRLGNTLTQQGLYSQAIYSYEASLQRDSRQSKPWFNLSTTYLLGAQLASLNAWESMKQNDPGRSTIKVRINAITQLLR